MAVESDVAAVEALEALGTLSTNISRLSSTITDLNEHAGRLHGLMREVDGKMSLVYAPWMEALQEAVAGEEAAGSDAEQPPVEAAALESPAASPVARAAARRVVRADHARAHRR
eukprot:PLAT9471.3.p2 GENE.PLAT9471.3~~PLAT9471.3.p2  ORF type:complete len:114 (+),score=46.23 PLAT9471.3:7-348(+)